MLSAGISSDGIDSKNDITTYINSLSPGFSLKPENQMDSVIVFMTLVVFSE